MRIRVLNVTTGLDGLIRAQVLYRPDTDEVDPPWAVRVNLQLSLGPQTPFDQLQRAALVEARALMDRLPAAP